MRMTHWWSRYYRNNKCDSSGKAISIILASSWLSLSLLRPSQSPCYKDTQATLWRAPHGKKLRRPANPGVRAEPENGFKSLLISCSTWPHGLYLMWDPDPGPSSQAPLGFMAHRSQRRQYCILWFQLLNFEVICYTAKHNLWILCKCMMGGADNEQTTDEYMWLHLDNSPATTDEYIWLHLIVTITTDEYIIWLHLTVTITTDVYIIWLHLTITQ